MISIDMEKNLLIKDGKNYTLGSPEGFKIISEVWLRSGWDTKYVYSFSWLGRPIIQLPEDMIRIQEVIFEVQPDVVIEAGIAHGGSLVYYASLLKAIGKGRVIGVDVEIRPHNRKAIEEHFLKPYITMFESSSIDEGVVQKIKGLLKPNEKVLVVLDSNHTKGHVYRELELYSELVTPSSYIIACDGIMEYLSGAPRTKEDWSWNNPRQAALEFEKKHPQFKIVEPKFPFNEGQITERVSYWPNCYLKRVE